MWLLYSSNGITALRGMSLIWNARTSMSIIHVRQIEAQIKTLFNGLVDLSDYDTRPLEREAVFLSRSLAAFTLMHLANITPTEAAQNLVDGGQDNGIDAIFCDK